MVKIAYDRSTGLIELRVQAFEPDDAKRIAEAIYDESSAMINDLSAAAREDATRYAKEELDKATTRVRDARVALTEFRSRTQIIDPVADLQGQLSIINTLQQQLTETIISQNLLRDTTQSGDVRIAQIERREAVIRELIEEERGKFGVGTSEGGPSDASDYSRLVGDFERLTVEREFAEQAHLVARTAYDVSLAEAQRQSRYLASHVNPTLAESSRYPQRVTNSLLIAGMLLLAWGIGVMIYYSVRDRR